MSRYINSDNHHRQRVTLMLKHKEKAATEQADRKYPTWYGTVEIGRRDSNIPLVFDFHSPNYEG